VSESNPLKNIVLNRGEVKMKIFSTSDIHGNFKSLQKIINFLNKRSDIDTVLFCGDIASDYRGASISELAKLQSEDYMCFKYMISEILNKRVFYIRGNHDVFTPDTDDMNFLPNVYKAGIEKELIPLEIMCIRFYETEREGTELDLADALREFGDIKCKILISHQPPLGCQDIGNSGHNYGSWSIREKLLKEKPEVVFCGHVHEKFGVGKLGNTLVINCACSSNDVRDIIYDTEEKICEEIIL
jgi:Icc-related predicted phosphoesterase